MLDITLDTELYPDDRNVKLELVKQFSHMLNVEKDLIEVSMGFVSGCFLYNIH